MRHLGELADESDRNPNRKAPSGKAPVERGALAVYLQSTGAVSPQLYAGINLSLGRPYTIGAQHNAVTIDPKEAFYAASGVLTFVFTETPIIAKAELVAGVYGLASHRDEAWLVSHAGLLEPRLAAELPLSAEWSLGLHLGWDLVRLEDQLVGVYLNMRGHATR